jgi:chitinase
MKLIKTLMLLSMVPGLLISKAYAYNCTGVAQYQEPNSYQTGTIVKNGGSAYQCTVGGWCNVGGPYAPGVGWAWTNAWSSLGACDGGTTSSVVASSIVASSRSSVASSVVTTTSSATSATNCSGLATWNATSVYTQGMQVSLNSVKYEAKWWTQNQNPTTNSSADGVWKVIGNCGSASSVASSAPRSSSSIVASSSSIRSSSSVASSVAPGGKRVVGYFAQWGVYARNYHVKNIATSGSASKLTHILYAFGNVQNGQCVIGDAYADYDRAYTADLSVDGVADTWDTGALRGSFGQLRKLKKLYPNIKVIWSFGGWTWSGGFGQAAANPTAFANSCYNLVEDPRWADVFDGIDIDWEYPNDCGLTCDTSGFSGYKNLIQALRTRFGAGALVTSAIGAAPSKINAADYAGAAQYLDFIMPMTYDYFGAFAAQGPTAPHSPLFNFPSIPTPQFYSDAAVQLLKSKGIPANKILLGVGFYGRGWTGVSQAAPGGSASGAATGSYEPGIEDYKVLKTKCPATGTVGGTAYAYCGNNWWSYDTPQTMVGKMDYVHQQNLGGTFFWELSGDTTNGELITVIGNSMR